MHMENLDVFKLSHHMAIEIYRVTGNYRSAEKFGLTSQMRRAVSSICMNLTEGAYRLGKKEFRRYVSIARGSCGELKYQVLLSKDFGYIEMNTFDDMTENCERIIMMLMKLYKALE